MIKNLTIVTQYFPPENGAAAERMKSFAAFFGSRCDLEVITSIPRHMMTDGNKTVSVEQFKITYVYGGKLASNTKKVNRLLNEVTFALRTIKILFSRAKGTPFLYTTPSPFLAIVALLFKKLKGQQFILDIRDLYPEVIADSGILSKSNPVYKIAQFAMKLAYENASILTYVNSQWSPQMNSVNPNAIFLPNGISAMKEGDISRDLTRREDLVIYSGNYGRMYDFDPILELAKRFQNHPQSRLARVKFLLIGDGIQSAYIKREVEKRELNNLEMIGPFSQKEVRSILHRGKVGLVSLNLEADSLKGAVPNKLFDYLETGLKTIALMPDDLSSEILSTGLITVHTEIDYDALVKELGDSILNYEYKKITMEEYPFLYRNHHLEKLLTEINASMS